MAGRREDPHVHADLGDDDFRGALIQEPGRDYYERRCVDGS